MSQAVADNQPGALVYRPSPDEQALGHAQALLAVMRVYLAGREQELADTRGQHAAFASRYDAQVGIYVVELNRLEDEIAAALARLCPEEAWRLPTIAKAQACALVTRSPEPMCAADSAGIDDLGQLYRAVAKCLHPDLAMNEADRERRTRLMAEANHAYASGDVGRLHDLLDAYDAVLLGRAAITASDVAAVLARVERALARVWERLGEIAAAIAVLQRSRLWAIALAVAAAERQGHDLLADLAAGQQAGIARARQHLAALRQRLHDRHGPRPARVLGFLEERALGTLFVRPRDSATPTPWQELGAARGTIAVPAEMDARLLIRRRADLTPLAALPADALQVLELALTGLTNTALPPLGTLTGLRELNLSGNDITDTGLVHLAALIGLGRLDLSRCYIGGDGLAKLAGLAGLEHLALAGPYLTNAALAHLAAFPLLRELDLGYTLVTDAGLGQLAALTTLRRLDLTGAAISPAGVAALRHALPTCTIVGGRIGSRDQRRARRPDPVRTLTELVAGR